MKLLRIIYYGAIPVLFIFAVYTGLVVLYMVLIAQLLLLAAVLVIDFITIGRLSFRQKLSSSSVVRGTPVTLMVELDTNTPVPLAMIKVHVEAVNINESIDLEFMPPVYGRKRFSFELSTPYRGFYQTGLTKIWLTDMFGLTTIPFDPRRRSFYKPAELTVYPRAAAPGNIDARLSDVKTFGDAYLRPASDGESIAGARRYMPGDPVKMINWKLSARYGEPWIRQFEIPARESVLIIIDNSERGLAREAALIYADTACECAASVALHTLSRGMETLTGAWDPVRGKTVSAPSSFVFEDIYSWLALLAFRPESSPELALDTLADASLRSVFIITREPEPELLAGAGRLDIRISVTMILVEDQGEPVGNFHTLRVAPGAAAAEALGEL